MGVLRDLSDTAGSCEGEGLSKVTKPYRKLLGDLKQDQMHEKHDSRADAVVSVIDASSMVVSRDDSSALCQSHIGPSRRSIVS